MRAWIVSDIHDSIMDRLWGQQLVVPDADLCICAGDVSDVISNSIAFIQRLIEPHMPVVLALGNHDYFGNSIPMALEQARRQVEGSRIHLLENESVQIDGCRFVGATLWTDFAIAVGGDEHIPPEERRVAAFKALPSMIPDFQAIYRSEERRIGGGALIHPQELLERHLASRSCIDRTLAVPFDGPTVVVTHHAPHPESFAPRFFGHASNAAFGSDLSELIARRRPSLWIHGHIHLFRDYLADRTRIICNPRGYGGNRSASGFRPDFVIDL